MLSRFDYKCNRHTNGQTECPFVHRVSKNLCKIVLVRTSSNSANFDNFGQKDGKEAKIM